MKFFIRTFGCQMNVCDSLWIGAALERNGFVQAKEEKDAQIILVNTCSVRKKPEEKIYSFLGRIHPLVKKNPNMIIGVGGCVAQQLGTRLWDKFPFVRLIFGTDGVAQVPQSILRLIQEPDLRISLLDFMDFYPERDLVWRETEEVGPSVYVNIMQGCDNFCAYCIVPYTRGRQKSRHSKNIIEECRILVEKGAKEITLLGQNVNSYGQDRWGDGTSFEDLLRQVSSIKGLKRLRFTTSHPKDISDELIFMFGELEVLSPAIHLPMQSGSDKILKKMGRKYSIRDYLKIVEKLRKVRDDIVITTDIIVGFPSETEEDFKQTLKIVEEVKFDSSFSFKYSDRPGTRASKMEDKVPEEIKGERLTILQDLQESLILSSLNTLKDTVTEVLVLGKSPKQPCGDMEFWMGREPGNRVVNFAISPQRDILGEMLQVKITEIKKHSVFGEVI